MPAIGAAIDNGKTEEPYWKRVFSGFEKSQEWMRETKPERRRKVARKFLAFSTGIIAM